MEPRGPHSIRAWHSEERAQLVLDSIREYAIFMLDPSGRVESWNTGAARILGYDSDEVLGKHFARFYRREESAQGDPDRDLQVARELGRFEHDGWRVRKGGSRFWASVLVTAMLDPGGQVEGFAVVVRDLTERRMIEEALRQSEEGLRLLVHQVKEYAIFRLDAAGHVASWNAGAERLKGYAAEEIIGQHFSRFYTEEDLRAGKPQRELEAATREGQCEDEGWRVRKDGSRFWANVLITALRSPTGELRGFGKVTRDLTASRSAEQERVRLARAEESVRLRDEFLSIASHELKTPITALRMQLQFLRRRLSTMDAEISTKFNRLTRSAERLGVLVDQLLDASRLATDRFALERRPLRLDEAVRDVVEQLRDAAEHSGCTITFTAAGEVIGSWDRARVQQVVANLLSNAMKFAAAAPVEVGLSMDRGEAVLVVADHGPGIAPDALRHLFGRFQRSGPVHNYGGMGLGLYVAREIVHAHGGSISAENGPQGGARITVRLPTDS
ncbi:MAG TPA: PAS domain S-box protein [Anaeromyxobacteraceae bacterium]|nr:PAS domain S-box protein [Anaeromyxobacteraceae bacterium]